MAKLVIDWENYPLATKSNEEIAVLAGCKPSTVATARKRLKIKEYRERRPKAENFVERWVRPGVAKKQELLMKTTKATEQ